MSCRAPCRLDRGTARRRASGCPGPGGYAGRPRRRPGSRRGRSARRRGRRGGRPRPHTRRGSGRRRARPASRSAPRRAGAGPPASAPPAASAAGPAAATSPRRRSRARARRRDVDRAPARAVLAAAAPASVEVRPAVDQSAWPVMNAESSRAEEHDRARRCPRGTGRAGARAPSTEISCSFSTCTGFASTPSLIVKPGATVLTSTPSPPTSLASALRHARRRRPSTRRSAAGTGRP